MFESDLSLVVYAFDFSTDPLSYDLDSYNNAKKKIEEYIVLILTSVNKNATYSIIAHGISAIIVKEIILANKYAFILDKLDSIFYINPSLGCSQNPFYSNID